MLQIGSFTAKACNGLSRRAFVTASASLPFVGEFGQAALGVGADTNRPAKSVILVWLWGGPSQLDTFDPKPDAPGEVRGPFATIPTRTPGVHVTEILPHLAKRSDKYALVRSSVLNANHNTQVLTGVGKEPGKGKDKKKGGKEPNFGAIVARQRRGHGLPPFIALTPRTTLSHGVNADKDSALNAGSFGSAYNPFFVRCSSRGELDVASLKLMPGLTPDRLADRRQLRGELEQLRRKVDGLPLGKYDAHLEGAYELLASPGKIKAFDLSKESNETRARYGRTYFGQAMLLARRLAEAEVPYIHVNWSQGVDSLEEGPRMGWDTHRNGFGQLFNYHGPILDRAMSALLDDLSDRGLLDQTLVSAFGEMGRTPKINGSAGRDHWATATTFWAGGGVQGGRVVGATDAVGGEPATEPKTARMIGATLCDAMGINAQQRAELGVLGGAEGIHELF